MVKVIAGPSKGRTARVMDMRPNGYYYLAETIPGSHALPTAQIQHPDGAEILIETAVKYLNLYRSDFDILDRLCKGDVVESLTVDEKAPRVTGIVQSVDDDGWVKFEQGYNVDGSQVSASAYFVCICLFALQRFSTMLAISLVKNDERFLRASRNPLLHKHVRIINGALKGYTGFVTDINHVTQQFTIGLDFSYANTLLERNSFIEIDADVNMRPRTPPPRSITPVPESISLAADSVLSDHVGDDSNSTSRGEYDPIASGSIIEHYLLGPQSFLINGVCASLTTHHIRTSLGPAFAHGNRQGYTTIPMVFDDTLQPSKIMLYYTDNKGRWVKQYRLLSELKPASPLTAKKEVIVLDGTHKGRIVIVHKIKKSEQMAVFKADGTEWQEPLSNVCLLAPHFSIGCDCERQMLTN